MKNKYVRISFEILVWTCFIVFPLILFPTLQPFVDKGIINPPLLGVIITHSLLIVLYYFNYYYALPKFYFKKLYLRYFPLMALCLAALILVMLSNPDFNPLPSPPFIYAKTAFVISVALRFMMMLLLSLGFASYNRLRASEAEKLKSELSYLKAQINPHFLFNTLNSIYALTVKKTDSASESITKLAAIMRYAITDAANDEVPLEKEINYIASYIELEKLRLTEKVKLEYEAGGDFGGKKISPMIFVPLIENAFKHGVSTVEESKIAIRIFLKKNVLTVTIKNTKVKRDKTNNNGLGISNVKKRLGLTYIGKHKLRIEDFEKEFFVNLELTLND